MHKSASNPIIIQKNNIDKYDVEENKILGKGGYSIVKLCKSKESGREYAMKKVR